jgi:hypothetical protein
MNRKNKKQEGNLIHEGDQQDQQQEENTLYEHTESTVRTYEKRQRREEIARGIKRLVREKVIHTS